MVEIIDDSIKKPYYDESLGAYIDSKSKRRKLMKKRGVTFAADYSQYKHQQKSVGKEHLPTRDQVAKMMAELKRHGGKLKK